MSFSGYARRIDGELKEVSAADDLDQWGDPEEFKRLKEETKLRRYFCSKMVKRNPRFSMILDRGEEFHVFEENTFKAKEGSWVHSRSSTCSTPKLRGLNEMVTKPRLRSNPVPFPPPPTPDSSASASGTESESTTTRPAGNNTNNNTKQRSSKYRPGAAERRKASKPTERQQQ